MNMIQVVLWVALITSSSQTSNSWKGIVPFQSTRNDVERVLGPPTRPCTEVCRYDTKTEGIFARYSNEPCKSGEGSPLSIPPNTVISVTVYPETKTRLRDLRLDRRKFTKTKDPELHGYSTYTNSEIGVTYEVSDKNMILSIEWFGSAKDIQRLRCPLRPSAFGSTAEPQRQRSWLPSAGWIK